MAARIGKGMARLLGYVLLALIFFYLLLLLFRPWHMRWGTSPDAAAAPLPGDQFVPAAKMVSTRSVLIHASAEQVWPWLVQMGQDKAGFYSYAWLENLAGLHITNADRIVPEWQKPEIGDPFKLDPKLFLPLYVQVLEPTRALVAVMSDKATGQPLQPGDYFKGQFAGSWAFVLEPVDAATSRLVVRFRIDWGEPVFAGHLVNRSVLEPVQFIMERKMLLGIKERAEQIN